MDMEIEPRPDAKRVKPSTSRETNEEIATPAPKPANQNDGGASACEDHIVTSQSGTSGHALAPNETGGGGHLQ